MFAATALALLAAASVVVADPTPLEPGPGAVFNEGQNCTTTWTPDSTGVWTTMNIELMTGDNFQQVHLKTIGTVDGTDTAVHSYSYPCLDVTPNSAIYFYKFSSPASANTYFTTRFTIADASGASVTPTATETATNGDIVPWGTGALTDPSQGDQPPASGAGSSNSTTAATTAAPTGNTNANTSGMQTQTRTSTTTGSTSSTSASSTHTGAGFRTLSLGSASVAILGAIGSALLL